MMDLLAFGALITLAGMAFCVLAFCVLALIGLVPSLLLASLGFFIRAIYIQTTKETTNDRT